MLCDIRKTLALPPTFAEQWRQAIDAWRGPPSAFRQLRELTERMREGADLRLPDALEHARAPAPPPGAPQIHEWDTIERLDAAYCRTYFADNNRAPTWKERHTALEKKLGAATPHLKTLQRHLPKVALLKERNSRSI
jgi:hypothetical protein